MSFCLLPDKVEEFKKALKDKDISLADLVNMESEERIKILEPYAGRNAKAISTAIEEKLILKNRVLGLKNYISKLTESGKYSPEKKAELDKLASEYRAAQQERVFNPKENEAYLSGLAEKIAGTEIPRDVAKKVFEMQSEMDKIKEQDAKLSGVSDEYLQKRAELGSYIASFKPLSVAASIGKNAAIFGRNALIANPATPIKASVAQGLNSAIDAVTRRIANLSLRGANPELASQANNEAWDTFKKTGMNTANMESMDDSHALGKGENFKLPTVPSNRPAGLLEKGVRKTAEISNKIVIDWAHNVPFTKFYQKTFFDMANFSSTDVAKQEGLTGDSLKTRAAEIFKDAARIEPQTEEGAMVRHQAQMQAARITSTNETLASRFSLGVKNTLNKVVPGFPLGDYILPIAKIPASALANAIDNAGAGIPAGIKDIYQGRKKIQSDNFETRYEGMGQFRNGIQRLSRIVGSLALGIAIASQLKKEDFRTDNNGAHFVKIGNTWINTEYISAISPSLAGAMAVKESGNVSSYIAGATAGITNLPGMSEAKDLAAALSGGKIKKYMTDFFTSRGEPAFIANLRQNRPANRLLFGAHGVESTQDVSADKKATADKAAATRAMKR